MTELNDDDKRYIRSKILMLEHNDIDKAIDREKEAVEDQKNIIKSILFWSQVLSGNIKITSEYLRGKE
jgi:hypothetical protein